MQTPKVGLSHEVLSLNNKGIQGIPHLPSSFSMITVAVAGDVKMSGLATDAVMVKLSSSSSTVSPMMLIS